MLKGENEKSRLAVGIISGIIDGMVAKRPGYRNLTTQLPDAVWGALYADIQRRGESITQALTRVLSKHYRIPQSRIPPPRRPGRRPKKK